MRENSKSQTVGNSDTVDKDVAARAGKKGSPRDNRNNEWDSTKYFGAGKNGSGERRARGSQDGGYTTEEEDYDKAKKSVEKSSETGHFAKDSYKSNPKKV